MPIAWSVAKVSLLLAAVGGGVCLFFGLIVLQATMCFWTVETLEIWSTVTYGGVETAQYPMSIYKSWFRQFFIYVVPLACVAYFPVVAVLGKRDPLSLAGVAAVGQSAGRRGIPAGQSEGVAVRRQALCFDRELNPADVEVAGCERIWR